MRIFKGANFDFVGKRKQAYIACAALCAVGIVAMIVNVASIGSWMQYGVDFTGGTRIQVRTAPGTTDAELRDALGGSQAPSIARYGSPASNEFTIRAPLPEGEAEDEIESVSDEIQTALTANLGEGNFEILSARVVGPQVGAELEQKALLAIFFSMLVILAYLAVRFEFRFGLAAIISTANTVFVTLGVLALFRFEISLTIVAAVLTVLGYSLNDTVIVFDRIRENLGKKGGRREDPRQLINRAINETLPRTTITASTALVTVIALAFFGSSVTRDFAIILLVGIAVATFSSIFLASPILLEIQQRWGTKEDAEARKKSRSRSKGTSPSPG